MPVAAVVELAVHMHAFRNLALADRGIYRVELVVETNGGVYPRGIPYLTMSAPARTGSLSRGVAVRDSDAVLEPMVVQHASSSVLSRSFYVRYSEEDFDVNDTVVFQLEKDMVGTKTPVTLKARLLRAEAGVGSDGRGRVKAVREGDYAPIAEACYDLHYSGKEIHAYVPVTFDTRNFCLLACTVHSCLTDIRFKSPPPQPTPEAGTAASSTPRRRLLGMAFTPGRTRANSSPVAMTPGAAANVNGQPHTPVRKRTTPGSGVGRGRGGNRALSPTFHTTPDGGRSIVNAAASTLLGYLLGDDACDGVTDRQANAAHVVMVGPLVVAYRQLQLFTSFIRAFCDGEATYAPLVDLVPPTSMPRSGDGVGSDGAAVVHDTPPTAGGAVGGTANVGGESDGAGPSTGAAAAGAAAAGAEAYAGDPTCRDGYGLKLGGRRVCFADRVRGLQPKQVLETVTADVQQLRERVFGAWQAFLAGLGEVRANVLSCLREVWLEDAHMHCHRFVVQRRGKVAHVTKTEALDAKLLSAVRLRETLTEAPPPPLGVHDKELYSATSIPILVEDTYVQARAVVPPVPPRRSTIGRSPVAAGASPTPTLPVPPPPVPAPASVARRHSIGELPGPPSPHAPPPPASGSGSGSGAGGGSGSGGGGSGGVERGGHMRVRPSELPAPPVAATVRTPVVHTPPHELSKFGKLRESMPGWFARPGSFMSLDAAIAAAHLDGVGGMRSGVATPAHTTATAGVAATMGDCVGDDSHAGPGPLPPSHDSVFFSDEGLHGEYDADAAAEAHIHEHRRRSRQQWLRSRLYHDHAAVITTGASATTPSTAQPPPRRTRRRGQFGSMRMPKPSPQEIDVVVFQNGLHGTAGDLRVFTGMLKLLFPKAVTFSASRNQAEDTDDSIIDCGRRLAEEVSQFLHQQETRGRKIIRHLSFVAHSLGGLIVRVALCHPALSRYRRHLRTFVCLAVPHMGTPMGTSSLFSTGLFVMRKWRKSTSLAQLSLKDGATAQGCLLYALAADRLRAMRVLADAWGVDPEALLEAAREGDEEATSSSDDDDGGTSSSGVVSGTRAGYRGGALTLDAASSRIRRMDTIRVGHPAGLGPDILHDPTSWFKHVLLVTSPQDTYCPVLSGTVVLSGDSDKLSVAHNEMVRGFWAQVDPSRVVRIGVRFQFARTSLDTMVGRAAHIELLDSKPFLWSLMVLHGHLLVQPDASHPAVDA